MRSTAGLKVLAPYLPDELKNRHYDQLLELELALGTEPGYQDIAVHLHVVSERPVA